MLKHRSILIQQVTQTSFPFLVHWRIYPGRFTSELGTVWSSFDSVIPFITVPVLMTMHLNSSFFNRKLFTINSNRRKCKPFLQWVPR